MSFIKLILNKINLTQRIETLKFHSTFERRLHNYPILKQFNGAAMFTYASLNFRKQKNKSCLHAPSCHKI